MKNVGDLLRLAKLIVISAAGIALLTTSAATAQDSYPSKPVTIVVSYPPGGSADILARILAQSLQKQLGRPFLVENRPGATGVIGNRANAKAAPDGYSLLFVSDTVQTSVPHLVETIVGFDPLKDYTPIGVLAESPVGIFANPKYNTLAELIADAKARPGQVKYSSSGLGSANELSTLLFSKQTGTQMLHVPYNGSAPAVLAVVSGQVDLLIATVATALDQVETDRLRMLAVADTARHKSLPNVPTTAEVGLPGYLTATWFGLEGPPGLPEPIVKTLNTALRNATQDPEFMKAAERSARISVSTPQEMKERIDRENQRWGEIIREAKATSNAPK
jgi:tripartite-type tricarboxylate transporter receptor subunit TctC